MQTQYNLKVSYTTRPLARLETSQKRMKTITNPSKMTGTTAKYPSSAYKGLSRQQCVANGIFSLTPDKPKYSYAAETYLLYRSHPST